MKKKILLIEDDKDQIELYRLSFQMFLPNIDVFSCSNPEEALKNIKDIKPDLILLDLVFRDHDGLDILRALRQDQELAQTKVIILTNLYKETLKEEAEELGALDYWLKTEVLPKDLALRVGEKVDS